MPEYVVLRKRPDGSWIASNETIEGATPADALRVALTDHHEEVIETQYVAVPEDAWRPHRVAVVQEAVVDRVLNIEET